ncbi:MAG: hypothetical protein JNK96_05330 [Betaproteobacteria bacterium]|jgi:hypothetical protein|nr:hypothetical protein [Betaproteobacteria bacterium]HMV19876.1 hypothetical protein [Rhodocyclaceae bacterium]HMW77007.1 hypothetical protein [Rhodocyclaceae bacterium]HNE42135.1 hypothetical protein [Rhodocyclaceae bacterium]HNL20549.1 hypothetical protein [Rhodocyclaceae bacterium]
MMASVKDPSAADSLRQRSGERRRNDRIEAPPYTTSEGLVLRDRRSHLERRSCWLRSFAIDGEEATAD